MSYEMSNIQLKQFLTHPPPWGGLDNLGTWVKTALLRLIFVELCVYLERLCDFVQYGGMYARFEKKKDSQLLATQSVFKSQNTTIPLKPIHFINKIKLIFLSAI